MTDFPGVVQNHQIVILFHDGPRSGGTAQFSVPDEKGPPQRIQIMQIDPTTAVVKVGWYAQSAFHQYLYCWAGWDADTHLET